MPLDDFRKEIYLCSRCGYCRDMVRARDNTDRLCPIRENTGGFEIYSSRGRNWIARQILEGSLSVKDFTEKFVDSLYSCLFCGNCTEHCLVLEPESWSRFPNNTFKDHIIDNNGITRSLRNLVVEEGIPPVEIRNVLHSVYRHGNPYGEPREKRDAWTKELGFNIKNATEERCEILFYVGSIASYNERNQKAVQAVARIMKLANVDFGIFGTREEDSGGEVRELGEEGLFEELAKRNLELFREHDITNVICFSPHDYNAFINYYPELLKEAWSRLNLKIQHYTEFLANLLRKEELAMKKLDKKVTFHDPCYLGRKNGIYDAPRQILQATGADLIEMRLSYSNSYCCGGGGGGLWYEPLDKPKVENERAKQALETGAEILAVACPNCAQMMEDGISAIEGKIRVMDIAEIVEETINI
ncbi:(Fe-S)-binding protein [Candidatus Bathyarchaeota archaeon]|nr:(Fe-S)-binding protein [Candidatus Bathyarchaeota archaeon]